MIGALILAAGFSQRFGSDKRLHQRSPGKPAMVVESLKPYPGVFDSCYVVVRESDDPVIGRIEREMGGSVVILRSNRSHLGMGASLAEGVRQIVTRNQLQALFVGLGDMPSVRTSSLVALREAIRDRMNYVPRSIVRPEFDGTPGHPVGFACAFFDDLLGASGDVGARQILESHPECVVTVSLNDPGICLDIDVNL